MKSLEIINAHLLYNKKTIAGLNGINLQIQEPGLYAIQGQSGCGKTTLLQVINNEKKLDTGEIKLDNATISKMPALQDIDQKKSILDILLNRNMEVFPELSSEKQTNIARESLMLLEITNEIHKPFDQLSSGQQQRVLIAMAICGKPDILMMDEPFSIIDQNTRSLILSELKKIIKSLGIIVLWVTHDSSDVLEFADKVLLMHFGKIIELKKPEEIFYKPSTFHGANYYGENNIFTCKYIQGMVELPWQNFEMNLAINSNTNILVSLRPQFVTITTSDDPNAIEVFVREIKFKGTHYIILTELEGHIIYCHSSIKPNDRKIHISMQLERLHYICQI